MEISLLSWVALLTFYMLYILLGGIMFNAIECQEEYRDQEAGESREIKLIMVDLLAQVLLDDNESSNFTSVIRRIRQLSASDPNFNVGHGAVQTAGYGRITLQTQWGRGICLIYSLLGVPVNAILIGTVGSYFGKKAKQVVGETTSASKKILLNALISTVPGIVMFILLPSALFCLVENSWTYLDSIYYAFINMTHIGFGDLINIHRDQEVATRLGPWMWAYRVFTVVWLVLGLGYMFMVTQHLSEGLYVQLIRKVSQKISKRFRKASQLIPATRISRSRSLRVTFPEEKAKNGHKKLCASASV